MRDRDYCVSVLDGPANGYTVIQFIPPQETILLMRNHPDVAGVHGEWIHVPADWHREGIELVRYKRGPLPSVESDLTVTVDGDWFVSYTQVPDE